MIEITSMEVETLGTRAGERCDVSDMWRGVCQADACGDAMSAVLRGGPRLSDMLSDRIMRSLHLACCDLSEVACIRYIFTLSEFVRLKWCYLVYILYDCLSLSTQGRQWKAARTVYAPILGVPRYKLSGDLAAT